MSGFKQDGPFNNLLTRMWAAGFLAGCLFGAAAMWWWMR